MLVIQIHIPMQIQMQIEMHPASKQNPIVRVLRWDNLVVCFGFGGSAGGGSAVQRFLVSLTVVHHLRVLVEFKGAM